MTTYEELSGELKTTLMLISRNVKHMETRTPVRAFRVLTYLRHRVSKKALEGILTDGSLFAADQKFRDEWLAAVHAVPESDSEKAMDVDHDAQIKAKHLAEKQAEKDVKVDADGDVKMDIAQDTPAQGGDLAAPSQSDAKASLVSDTKQAQVPKVPLLSVLPEGQSYVALLVASFLIDHGAASAAKDVLVKALDQAYVWNRRTMDSVTARLYFFWVRAVEVLGEDTSVLRPTLMKAYRQAHASSDVQLESMLLTLLLRNYLQHHMVDQADQLVHRAEFPEDEALNSYVARWYYYLGRISAIQLDYADASRHLEQALRRVPASRTGGPKDTAADGADDSANGSTAPANGTDQNAKERNAKDTKPAPPAVELPAEAPEAPEQTKRTGLGFLQTVTKLSIIVDLLMGKLPERKVFRDPDMEKSLAPYLAIVRAVRVGNLAVFNEALQFYDKLFKADGNYDLVLRLRHNVIKTALRTLATTYSQISLRDVAHKLRLESEEDAEYIVAKSIRDGVIDAVIDHSAGVLRSRDTGNLYATAAPQRAFDDRIQFLLELRNSSVRAMKYPVNVHEMDLVSVEEAREREREIAMEIEDADEFDPEMDGF